MIHDETGTGLLGSAAGTLVVVTLLLFAVQLSLNLSTVSQLDAVGYDAARDVASRRVDHADPAAVRRAAARAEDRIRADLGRSANVTDLHWDLDDGAVHLTVEVVTRRAAPRAITSPVGLDRVRRTFVVRMERAR